jgi:hypothetical protein
MQEGHPFKEWFKDFLNRLLPVVTGIAITFTVQGMVNRAHDRKAVRSAMELVRTELTSNLEDITHMNDYLKEEQSSAKYLVDHKDILDTCPAEIVRYHKGIVNAYVHLVLSDDALELLKMSSLFPKIGDNPLSMKIISAYDTCELMEEEINGHFKARDAHIGSVTSRNDHTDEISAWVLDNDPLLFTTDVLDIEEAINAIDNFLINDNPKDNLLWRILQKAKER